MPPGLVLEQLDERRQRQRPDADAAALSNLRVVRRLLDASALAAAAALLLATVIAVDAPRDSSTPRTICWEVVTAGCNCRSRPRPRKEAAAAYVSVTTMTFV